MVEKVNVTQKENSDPIPVEVIADSIKAISDGSKKLRNSSLNDKALFLLIQHACPSTAGKYKTQKPRMGDIRSVITGIELLEETYLK